MKKVTNTKMNYTVLILILAASFFAYAFSSGITGRTLKSGTSGCECHGAAPSTVVNVIINGPDLLGINETAEYTVTISGGPAASGGTNIASSGGTLNPSQGSGLQKIGAELTHTSPKGFTSGSVTFKFNLTAPSAAGNVILFANGNSVNLNGQNSGDSWNFAQNKTIEITTATGVDKNATVKSFRLEQNFPNPFNPTTNINFSIPVSGNVKLVVYNSIGAEVAVLVNDYKSEGEYSYNFNGKNLTSGVYYYKLFSGNGIITKKMLMIK